MSLPESSVGKSIGYFLDWWFMWEGQLHVSGGGPGAIKRQAGKTGGDKPVSSVSLHQPVSALGSCLTSLDDRLQPISEINPSPSYLWLWCFIALMETLTQTQSLHFFFFITVDPHSFWSLSDIVTPSKSLSVPHCPGPFPPSVCPYVWCSSGGLLVYSGLQLPGLYFLQWGGHSGALTLHALERTLLVLAFSTLIPSCSYMCENIFDSLCLDNLPMSLVFGLKSF